MRLASSLAEPLETLATVVPLISLLSPAEQAEDCRSQDHRQHQRSHQGELGGHVITMATVYYSHDCHCAQDFFHNPPSYKATVQLSWGAKVSQQLPENVCLTHTTCLESASQTHTMCS